MTSLTVEDAILPFEIPVESFVVEGIRDLREVEPVIAEAEADVKPGLSATGIDGDPVLGCYRDLHARVGARPRDVAAPEVLRRMLLKAGRLPRIGPIVDTYNAFSLRSRLALGAHDVDRIDGDVQLRITTGDERFVPLGKATPTPVRKGEYAYVDEADEVLCRLEVRQGDKTKVTAATDRCLIIVQGNAELGEIRVSQGASELAALLTELGAKVTDSPAPGLASGTA